MAPAVRNWNNVLSSSAIDYILGLSEVLQAKQQIDEKSGGSVYFSMHLTSEIKSTLYQTLGLDLSTIDNVPMRWMKGDTAPHIDTGTAEFDDTYLMYLTDSTGSLIVDGNSYPITKGSAYVFSESLRHETVQTGTAPRLLLGPMSEKGFAVGYSGISGPGGTTLYIRQSGSNYQYSNNQTSWSDFSFPIGVTNTNASAGILTVEFVSDITFSSLNNYFSCESSHIQFGSTILRNDGTRPIITIDGVSNYYGIIQNGSISNTGKNNIYVYNLDVRTINGSTQADKGGWIGQAYFGKDVTDNYIVNCSSDGPIGSNSSEGGGIVGSYVASGASATLTIIGCSSSGNIGINSGGIVGTYAGNTGAAFPPAGGTINCESCWSTGSINIASGAGGIFGEYAGDSAIANATNCYSTGAVGASGGGIYGRFAGRGGRNTATNCYSLGAIGTDGGGIYGRYAGWTGNSGTPSNTSASNCYSAGTITTSGNGIYGSSKINGTITNCYSADGNWSSASANSSLQGTPSTTVGATWVSAGLNQPYELFNMGYNPYTTENIDISAAPALNRVYSSTIVAGNSTSAAIVSGQSYTILQIAYGDSGSYGTLTVDSTSGAISTASSTVADVYTIYIRNNGSYNITRYILTVTPGGGGGGGSTISCCEKPMYISNLVGNTIRTELRAGNVLIGSTRRTGPISYDEIMARKKANASKR